MGTRDHDRDAMGVGQPEEAEVAGMGTTNDDRDTMGVGQPEEAELADQELGRGTPAEVSVSDDAPEDEKAEAELEPLEGGAETMADLEEEAGQANRPGTERPPV
jgi:hypothetical protein